MSTGPPHGFEPHSQDGNTALHLACAHGHGGALAALLAAPGIDVNPKGRDLLSPLNRADVEVFTPPLSALAASGGSKKWREGQQQQHHTPLHHAAANGRAACVAALLAAPGILFDEPDGSGLTALYWAASMRALALPSGRTSRRCRTDYAACLQLLMRAYDFRQGRRLARGSPMRQRQ